MTAPFNAEEREVARHLLHHVGHSAGGKPGSFSSALITCFERADPANRERLLHSFPAYRSPLNVLQWFGRDALADMLKGGQ